MPAKKPTTVKARSAAPKVAVKVAPARKVAKKAVIAQKVGKTEAPKSLEGKRSASVVTVGRVKHDWEAIERDYRTGKFTLRELEAKHGPSYAEISRRSKRESWTKDLRNIIRQATDAAVLQETVTAAQKDVTETVLVAAETNKRVILEHRNDIRRARQLANMMLDELEQITVAPAKVNKLVEVLTAGEEFTASEMLDARNAVAELVKLPNRILSAQRLSQVMARLQPLERKAFGLDDEVPPPPDELDELSDDDLDRRIEESLVRRNNAI